MARLAKRHTRLLFWRSDCYALTHLVMCSAVSEECGFCTYVAFVHLVFVHLVLHEPSFLTSCVCVCVWGVQMMPHVAPLSAPLAEFDFLAGNW